MRDKEQAYEVRKSIERIRSFREEQMTKLIVQYFEKTYNKIRDKILQRVKWNFSYDMHSLVLIGIIIMINELCLKKLNLIRLSRWEIIEVYSNSRGNSFD
jgi:hypothetical protein